MSLCTECGHLIWAHSAATGQCVVESCACTRSVKLPIGTLVEVVDPNYKTRVVGVLLEEGRTNTYRESWKVSQSWDGRARVIACGYVSRKALS